MGMESVESAIGDVKSFAYSAFEASKSKFNSNSTSRLSPPPSSISSSSSGVLATRPPRNWVSIWTCSKLCAACFVAGIFVGYTLKRRVRRWLSCLLRRLKDD